MVLAAPNTAPHRRRNRPPAPRTRAEQNRPRLGNPRRPKPLPEPNPASDCRNNIVSGATQIGIFVGDADRATIQVDHNLGHQNGRYGYWFPDPQPSLADFQAASGQASSSLEQDPRFVDTTSGSEDLHLRLTDGTGTGAINPVLQAGAMLGTMWIWDIDGGQFLTSSRPIGADDPGAGVTRFFYEGVECIEEQDIYGGTSATYVYGTGLDEVLELQSSAGQFFLHTKSLGSIAKATDSGGAVAEQYSYTEYGERTIRDAGGSVTGESGIGNVWAFTGRRSDRETGLYHYRARAYDSEVGRFVQRDPTGNWSDIASLGSGYVYAGSCPTRLSDPLGLQAEGEWTLDRILDKTKEMYWESAEFLYNKVAPVFGWPKLDQPPKLYLGKKAIERLAGYVYGETGTFRPRWKNPEGPKKVSNYDPESAEQLHRGRKAVAEVVLNRLSAKRRGKPAHYGPPSPRELKHNENVQREWKLSIEAVKEALTDPEFLDEDPLAQHFYFRAGTTRGRQGAFKDRPWYIRDKSRTPDYIYGPFRNIGGSGDVRRGDDIYVDVYSGVK